MKSKEQPSKHAMLTVRHGIANAAAGAKLRNERAVESQRMVFRLVWHGANVSVRIRVLCYPFLQIVTEVVVAARKIREEGVEVAGLLHAAVTKEQDGVSADGIQKRHIDVGAAYQ